MTFLTHRHIWEYPEGLSLAEELETIFPDDLKHHLNEARFYQHFSVFDIVGPGQEGHEADYRRHHGVVAAGHDLIHAGHYPLLGECPCQFFGDQLAKSVNDITNDLKVIDSHQQLAYGIHSYVLTGVDDSSGGDEVGQRPYYNPQLINVPGSF